MKRIPIAWLCFLITFAATAQKSFDGLVQAERNFAAFSVAHNTRDAFLHFLDSAGLVFNQGKPVNGIMQWKNRPVGPGVLSWYPQYALIAASQDFGFTSGPYTFRPTKNDSIAGRGQYTTVWHLDQNGEWKFLVDLGIGNAPVPVHSDPDFCMNLENTGRTVYRGTAESMLQAEREFIRLTSTGKVNGQERKDWYRQYLAPEYVLNRNNMEPVTMYDLFLKLMNEMPASITYTIQGSGIAPSGDLGFVYGSTVINGNTDNYLRIWLKEKDSWKIIVEVLRY